MSSIYNFRFLYGNITNEIYDLSSATSYYQEYKKYFQTKLLFENNILRTSYVLILDFMLK